MDQNVEIPFLIISSRVLKDVRLNDSSKVLFCHLINYINNDDGACYASNSYLAEICNCKETSIKDRLNLLEKCGYIKRVTKKNGILWDRKIYPILDVPIKQEKSEKKGIKNNFTNSATGSIVKRHGDLYLYKKESMSVADASLSETLN